MELRTCGWTNRSRCNPSSGYVLPRHLPPRIRHSRYRWNTSWDRVAKGLAGNADRTLQWIRSWRYTERPKGAGVRLSGARRAIWWKGIAGLVLFMASTNGIREPWCLACSRGWLCRRGSCRTGQREPDRPHLDDLFRGQFPGDERTFLLFLPRIQFRISDLSLCHDRRHVC